MNEDLTKEQRKALLILFYVRPLSDALSGTICTCCGTAGSGYKNSRVAVHKGRINYGLFDAENPIPDIPDGFDGILIPDTDTNALIAWETQTGVEK